MLALIENKNLILNNHYQGRIQLFVKQNFKIENVLKKQENMI